MLNNINPADTGSWKRLIDHHEDIQHSHMKDMFTIDRERFNRFSASFEDIFLDYSKNIINEHTMALLVELANEVNLKDGIEKMFSGEKINETENRAVLHTALRNTADDPVVIEWLFRKARY